MKNFDFFREEVKFVKVYGLLKNRSDEPRDEISAENFQHNEEGVVIRTH